MENCAGKKFKSKVQPSRNFDICYDSTIKYPSVKDYNRELRKAVAAATQYVVRPYFQTMFSDTRPRIEWKSQCVLPVLSDSRFQQTDHILKDHAMISQRLLYFKQPISRKIEKSLEVDLLQPLTFQPKSQVCVVFHKYIQTDFRDSETQTDPWTHDVLAVEGSSLLQLNWLHIDSYATPGMSEITKIQRFWQKQAWEEVLPKMELVHKTQRLTMTCALAENDTITKDSDIEEINQQRLLLIAENLKRKLYNHSQILNERLERFAHLLRNNKSETFFYLKHKLCRDLRKLGMKHRGVETKYKSRFFRDVLSEITDKASNLNAPQLRFGDDPSKKGEIGEIRCRNLTDVDGLGKLETKVIHSSRSSSSFKSYMKQRNSFCKRRMIDMEQEPNLTDDVGDNGCLLLKPRELLVEEVMGKESGWAEDDERFHAILAKCIQARVTQNELSVYLSK